MTEPTRISNSGLKCLKVLFALKGRSLNGVSNGDLAKGLNESPATINRCLNTLITSGAAIKLDSGRYALSVAMLQVAQCHAEEMSTTTNRINELNQRIAAGSR
jgi:DNA-binding IclR family transcriptional regulator